jgi:hypothetical protein
MTTMRGTQAGRRLASAGRHGGVLGGHLFGVFVAVFSGLSGPGCKGSDEPIDPAAEAQVVATRAHAVVSAPGKSLAFAEAEDSFVQKLGRQVDNPPTIGRQPSTMVMALAPLGEGPAILARALPPVRAFMGHPEKAHNPAVLMLAETVADADETLEAQFEKMGADLEVLLRDRILAAGNIEENTESRVTYLLRPTPTCLPLPSAGETEIDAECAEDLMKLPVRVVMTRDGDGVRLSVQLGADRAEIFAFIVHSNELALEFDLPATKLAVEAANAAFSTPAEPADVTLEIMSGKIKWALTKLGDARAMASFWVLTDVQMLVSDAMRAPVFGFTSERRAGPALSMTADAAMQTIVLAADLGQTTWSVPWDPNGTGVANQDLKIVLGGYNATTLLSDASDRLTITGFGYGDGPTHVDVRGNPIFTMDMNPTTGRKMDMTMSVTPAEQMRIELAPQMDLNLAFKFAGIASDFGPEDQPPSFLLDESLRILLSGANPVAVEGVAANEATGFGGGLRAAAGTIAVSSSKGPSVTVPTGQCLVGKEAAAGEHELIGGLAAVACP